MNISFATLLEKRSLAVGILLLSCSLFGSQKVLEGGVEHVLDTNVEFIHATHEYTVLKEIMGFSKGEEPSEAIQQAIVMYDEELQEMLEEKVLIPGRDRRKRVETPTHYPYSCFGHINMIFSGESYGGSGVLVGPQHALTAAHCVYDFKKRAWADSVSIYCALSDKAAPYGKVSGVRLYVPDAYIKSKDARYDVALVVLDQPVGYSVGWLGCIFTEDLTMFKEPVSVTGYPGDKGFKQMWTMSQRVARVDSERITYDIDTYGGQSGSPIWSKFQVNTQSNEEKLWPMVVGIHTHGGAQKEGNSGIHLTEEKFNFIMLRISQTRKFAVKLIRSPKVKARSAVKVLVVKNNDDDSIDYAQLNAQLWQCASQGKPERVAELIKLGADVNQYNELGRTPLLAVLEARPFTDGHREVVKILINCKADVNACILFGLTLRYYKESGINRITPLCFAVAGCHTDIVRLLLNHKANPKILVRGAEPSPIPVWGSLLHVAVHPSYFVQGSKELIEFLLEHGVDPHYNRNSDGRSTNYHLGLFDPSKDGTPLMCARYWFEKNMRHKECPPNLSPTERQAFYQRIKEYEEVITLLSLDEQTVSKCCLC